VTKSNINSWESGGYIFPTKTVSMEYNFYFKIFNSIKSEHEPNELAYLELLALFGDIVPIYNFVDYLIDQPLRTFTDNSIRIQDIITMELPYGKIQGYFGQKKELMNITNLVKRLAYTREIFLIVNGQINPNELLRIIFPDYTLDMNTQFFTLNDKILFRFITNQFFLEKSEYISKTCKTKEEIDNNITQLFSYLTENYYRIPSSSTSKHNTVLYDQLAIREENSLYLNHYMHPYKGKSHPKMIRSLINYVLPNDSGVILDNFAGSGTTLVESNFLGLNSLGVEINPLSVLMSKTKCHSFKIPIDDLHETIKDFIPRLNYRIVNADSYLGNITTNIDSGNLLSKLQLSYKKLASFRIGKKTIDKIFLTKDIIKEVNNKEIRDFLLLSLSGTISDLLRRTSDEYIVVFRERVYDLFNRLYLFNRLNDKLKISLGNSETICADTRDLSFIKSDSVDGIINSPPYLTALNYIENDYPQLVLLDLVNSWDKLDENMIGNPQYYFINETLYGKANTKIKNYQEISSLADNILESFSFNNKDFNDKRIKKFIFDMSLSMNEMHRVLKPKSKCAIIIGNNHFKIGKQYQEIPNDVILQEIAKILELKEDKIIDREVHKSSAGLIQKEKILIFEK